MHEVNQMELK